MWLGDFQPIEIWWNRSYCIEQQSRWHRNVSPPSELQSHADPKKEKWAGGWASARPGGSASAPPIAPQRPLLLDEALHNTWRGMWSEDEVCILSCINENNEIISYYGVNQRPVCPNVKAALFFSTARVTIRGQCVCFLSVWWQWMINFFFFFFLFVSYLYPECIPGWFKLAGFVPGRQTSVANVTLTI